MYTESATRYFTVTLNSVTGRSASITVCELAGVTSVNHGDAASWRRRSEEHTSELQSQSNLVCRLLLEKKKQHLRALTPAPPAIAGSGLHRARYCISVPL